MWKSFVVGCVSVSLFSVSANAQFMSVRDVTRSEASASHRLLKELDRPGVKAKVEAMGVSFTEARARIAGLSDAEAQKLIQQNGIQEAGGDVLISLTTILLIVLIVVLID